MGQVSAPPNMQLSKLANHLRLMEDLWQKLVYVRWSQESFALLARLGQEMAQFTQEQGSPRQLSTLAQQLSQHLHACVGAGHLPQESDRERLRALFKQLNYLLRAPDEITAVTTNPLLSSKTDVLVVASEKPLSLLSKLGDAGYETHYLAVATEIESMLRQATPTAVIVDIDSNKGPLAGVEMIAELRARDDFLTTPVFFISERDDMEARLEAFRAGGTGYLTKPVDITELLEGLRNILQQSEERHCRVLIVNDKPDEAQVLVDLLESRNIGTRTVGNALQVIQEIYRFQPDLLLLDLDVKHVSGLELAGVLAQHKVFDVVPIILLSSAADLNVHLSRLRMGNAWVDLLLKPVIPDYLCWIIQQRLHRGQTLSSKLSTLSDKDAATGLYNRGYFLSQLEHNLASLGVSTKSLSVVFIMVENYRALRDATSVTVVDELVEHVAKRMRRVVGPHRWVARFSDAIFAILLTDIPQDALMELSRAVRDTLENTPYELIEYSLRLRTCIGISIASEPEQDVLSLIRSADAACTRARELKKERIYIQKYLYADWDKTDNQQQQQLMSDIDEALNLKRLKLLFQPIVSLQSDQAERYEVLLRIYNPNGQEMPIKTVFNAVQNHPLGQHLDRWVIAEAIRLLTARRAQGIATTLFIKLSAITLSDKNLPAWLQEQLSNAQLGADHLVFQLPERVAERNVRNALDFFSAIRRLGCGFSLEGFGRGPDSLGLLKTLPADCVKLDLFFSRDVGNDANKQEQLQELIVRLETLETATIVSGIEDMRALPILWSLGINYVQGFFLQQPYEEMTYDFKDGTF